MNLSLATKRRWNWKVFLVLVALAIPAAYSIIPLTIDFANANREAGELVSITWQDFMLGGLSNILTAVLPGTIGLLLANRIGLGMPFVEGWTRREPVSRRFRCAAAVAVMGGIATALLILFLDYAVFFPLMKPMFTELGISLSTESYTPPLHGFLGAFSAGVREEMIFRLFGLSLLAWLGGLLFHDGEGRPRLAVFWAANLLIVLPFAAGHISVVAGEGWPITALVVTRVMVLNSLGGIIFGWLFIAFGLESAMLAHFLADTIFYTLFPLSRMPDGEMGRILATAGAGLVILLALAWGWRTFRREARDVTGAELRGKNETNPELRDSVA